MSFELPKLPYELSDLEPHISKETMEFHYGKHHAGYVDKLNKAIKGSGFEDKTLEEIIINAEPGGLFNNAAQVWNHTFYWHSMTPKDTGPEGDLEQAIRENFDSVDRFKETFSEAAKGHFGSGWAWLVKDKNSKSLRVMTTKDADTPIRQGIIPLLTCDVWEHAFYIDYRNDKAKYVEAFWNLVNWDFVAQNLESNEIQFRKAS
ncbi:MAG TPA: superoxide dismutase [Gammaproteobacteria bacterium]|nr:superoxide dismutase [Gammaproteobacteria bacterium]